MRYSLLMRNLKLYKLVIVCCVALMIILIINLFNNSDNDQTIIRLLDLMSSENAEVYQYSNDQNNERKLIKEITESYKEDIDSFDKAMKAKVFQYIPAKFIQMISKQ